VTFIVTADTHVGYQAPDDPLRDPVKDPRGIERLVLVSISEMNAIGRKPWPGRARGVVPRPRGVFVAGDLTESGTPKEWETFQSYFGLHGGDGLLHYPVYETAGNHDYNRGWYVRRGVEKRHGQRYYAVDWDDLHIACLGINPGEEQREWLKRDLATVGKQRPIVVIMHYPLLGPFSDDDGADERRAGLARVLDGYNVVGIFHGHYHASGYYRWENYDVFNVGSVKYEWKTFEVVRVTDDRMLVASWNAVTKAWWWWHDKPVNGAKGEARHKVLQTPAGVRY
jgi:cytolysin (calcineurin-like family phosphatase)